MSDQEYRILVILVLSTTVILTIIIVFLISILFVHQRNQYNFARGIAKVKVEYEDHLLRTQLEIQEQTFQDISREIHDNIGQVLTLSKFQLNSVCFDNLDKAKSQVESSIDLISEAISDLSDISRSLSSETIINFGLIRTLEAEIERVHNLGWLELSLVVIGETYFLNAAEELIIFRIIQEGLNNIVRHSRASRVEVILNYQKSGLEIKISDDGIGFDPNQNSGLFEGSGLVNMKKRTALLKGSCEILSEPGEGTTIVVSTPKIPVQ